MGKNQNRRSKRDTLAARTKLIDRDYTDPQWDKPKKEIQKKLLRFYPDKTEMIGTTIEQSANEWANHLVEQASQALDLAQWRHLRTFRAQLKIEHTALLKPLKDALANLDHLSRGLHSLLKNDLSSPPGVDANVSDCRNKLKELIQRMDTAGDAISRLPKAKKPRDAQHEAAVEMAIVVLRALKNMSISIAATADADLGHTSDAVQILKIIGDGLGLLLAPLTWKRIIIEAKPRRSPRK
ncbi:MAG: hypothetical protein A3G20_05065 [Acidobacteria bacterium RIFCSPLOWO2_12_FULL_59_11]|nr:MAG: hypothetical protein A3G20_05065 [Acidobacteria bacterium RIFCSPLOWO2_12_FULL_59_11]